MSTALTLHVNGNPRTLAGLSSPTPLPQVIAALAIGSRWVAVEHNGEIIPHSKWEQAQVSDGDRLEIVHFVGGGSLSR